MLILYFSALLPAIGYADDPDDYFAKAVIAHKEGKASRAQQYYYRAWRADPDNTEAVSALVDIYYVQKRDETALRILDRALEQRPDAGQLWARRGLIYRRMGKIDEATKAYEKAVTVSPEDTDVLQRAAGFYQLIGNQSKAEALSQTQEALLMAPGE